MVCEKVLGKVWGKVREMVWEKVQGMVWSGGSEGAPLSQFHAVFRKIWQNRMLVLLPRRVGNPPTENPGSASGLGNGLGNGLGKSSGKVWGKVRANVL